MRHRRSNPQISLLEMWEKFKPERPGCERSEQRPATKYAESDDTVGEANSSIGRWTSRSARTMGVQFPERAQAKACALNAGEMVKVAMSAPTIANA